MTTKRALRFRVRADKTGPAPAPGEPWPCVGVEIDGDFADGQIDLPATWVERWIGADWLEVSTIGVVERPSRPDPAVDDNGSTAVPDEHRLPVDGMPAPHVFRHAEKIVIHTLNCGDVVLKVVHQPDKYVDSDDPTEQVTPEVYAEGRTRVEAFYGCEIQKMED